MSIPITRGEMRGMKEKKDEELRIEKINRCVQTIYQQAIKAAETSTSTTYSFDIDPGQTRQKMHNINDQDVSEYIFYKDNMTEILVNLWSLFPGCTVKLAKMCTCKNGKRYDISTMNNIMLAFINPQKSFECIVIDWS